MPPAQLLCFRIQGTEAPSAKRTLFIPSERVQILPATRREKVVLHEREIGTVDEVEQKNG